MNDQLISFETANLAKEKGFKEESYAFYFEDGEFSEYKISDTYGYYGDEYTVEISEFYSNWNSGAVVSKEGVFCYGCTSPKYFETFSAPTQSLLQKWLREKYNIHIHLCRIEGKWHCDVYTMTDGYEDMLLNQPMEINNCPSYEDALEKGLIIGLNNVK